MGVHLSRSLLERISALAAADPGREICGLLLGRDNDVETILPAANVSTDPARSFEVDPATLIAAHRAARQGGRQVLGHYHSHPSGDVAPSAADAASASADGALWLIAGKGGARLWRAAGEGVHGMFVPVEIVG